MKCRFVIELGASAVILDELSEFHSAEINPAELCIPHGVYEAIAIVMKGYPLLSINTVILAYNTDGPVSARVRPSADVAEYIKQSDIKALAGRDHDIKALEQFCKTMRLKHEPVLTKFMPRQQVQKQ